MRPGTPTRPRASLSAGTKHPQSFPRRLTRRELCSPGHAIPLAAGRPWVAVLIGTELRAENMFFGPLAECVFVVHMPTRRRVVFAFLIYINSDAVLPRLTVCSPSADREHVRAVRNVFRV